MLSKIIIFIFIVNATVFSMDHIDKIEDVNANIFDIDYTHFISQLDSSTYKTESDTGYIVGGLPPYKIISTRVVVFLRDSNLIIAEYSGFMPWSVWLVVKKKQITPKFLYHLKLKFSNGFCRKNKYTPSYVSIGFERNIFRYLKKDYKFIELQKLQPFTPPYFH